MTLLTEEVHGLSLNGNLQLAVPQTIGTCACGGCVELPWLDDTDEAECVACGRTWRLSLIVKVSA